MSSSTPLPLQGKVAVITGGSKGIGRAIAIRLARDGANVVINYSSDESAATEVLNIIGAERSMVVKADAGDIKDIEYLVDKTVKAYGKIDILVPSAAIMPLKDLEGTTEEDFDRVMKLNVKGPYFLAQKAGPHMAPGSHIVFFSTTQAAASTVAANYLPYVTSKGAVEQMTRVMSKDLARKGISVNAVAPGPTATDMFLKGKSEQLLKTIAGFNPQNRIGSPEEVADVVAFLGGDASRWVTGQVLKVNGGMA